MNLDIILSEKFFNFKEIDDFQPGITNENSNKKESLASTEKKPDSNKHNVFIKLLPTLVLIALATLVFMTIYEATKELIHPNLRSWQSHSITIAVATIIAPIVSYFALKKIELLRLEALKEIIIRKNTETELCTIKNELESLVNERTYELQVSNKQLSQEISIRKNIEKDLRESEYKFRLLFMHSPVGIFYYTNDLFITNFNDKFLEIFNSTREKEINFDIKNIKDKRIYDAITAPALGNDGFYEGAYNTTNGSSEIYISLKTSPLRNYKGNIIGGVAIVENISERKFAEKTLIEAKEKAERLDKLKSEFLAMISHEIRTPFNSILLGINFFKDELRDHNNPELLDIIDSINAGGNRITRTIELILNMSDILTGGYEIKPGLLDINTDILSRLYNEYHKQAEIKKLNFELNVSSSNTNIVSDSFTIEQIFRNLIDNAIKFTSSGNVEIRVERDDDQRINVSIIDSGIGISKEYMPRLFNLFSQEENGYRRGYDGNGLGLALVKKYCEILNSEISVKSEKGKGSCFTVILNDFPSKQKF